eukprot:gene11499-biopygen7267
MVEPVVDEISTMPVRLQLLAQPFAAQVVVRLSTPNGVHSYKVGRALRAGTPFVMQRFTISPWRVLFRFPGFSVWNDTVTKHVNCLMPRRERFTAWLTGCDTNVDQAFGGQRQSKELSTALCMLPYNGGSRPVIDPWNDYVNHIHRAIHGASSRLLFTLLNISATSALGGRECLQRPRNVAVHRPVQGAAHGAVHGAVQGAARRGHERDRGQPRDRPGGRPCEWGEGRPGACTAPWTTPWAASPSHGAQ